MRFEGGDFLKILNFGSINIDYVYTVNHIAKEGETITSLDLKKFLGGKGFNQSLAIGRAGEKVYHAGLIGIDGLEAKEELSKNNVDIGLIDVCDSDRTGNAIIQKDIHGKNCIILYPGANRKLTKKRIEDIINKFNSGDFIILQNEINLLPEIVSIAKNKNMVIIFNPSPLDEKVFDVKLDLIDYFILNEIEAFGLIKQKVESISDYDLARKLIEKYPTARFVLTLGDKGAIYIDNDNYIKQDICKVEVVDTTAAGDTFTGYFIAGLKNGKSIEEIMKTASIAAAVAVTRLGAEPSIPTIEEVNNYIKLGGENEKIQ